MKTARASLAFLLPALLVPAAAAQSPGTGADLSLGVSKLATTPLVGDVFEVVFTVRNEGPGAAPDASFSSYVSPELEVQALTSSDPGDTCGEEQPVTEERPPPPPPGEEPRGAAPDSFRGGGVYCALGTMETGESATLTMTARRVGARESYVSAWVGSYAEDPRYENNNGDFTLSADRSRPADVGVAIDAPKAAAVDGDLRYRILVTNSGPSPADATRLTIPAVYGLDLLSVTPARPADVCSVAETSDVECEIGSLAVGETAIVEVATRRSSAYEIWGSVWVQGSGYDEVYENDYADFYLAADPSVTSDLSVRMTAPATTPLVGERFDFRIAVANEGPSAAGDVWLSDYLPPGVEFVSSAPADACTFNDYGRYPMAGAPAFAEPGAEGDAYYPIAPEGVFCDLGSIAAGEVIDLSITVD
ncbi:MAG: DUF11 domain-containing protein, partial [Actinomycetota bacterium]|nr:DUF11 domain-containing protein [Actinomycetota bacterium]